jgi:HEPN domain-containing protein
MTRRARSDPEVAAWLAKSKSDSRIARAAVEIEGPLWDQACFHAQQSAEKAIKALFVACDLDVPRTHDLVFLVERLAQREPSASSLLETASGLAQHAVTPRYPSFLAPETEEDAREALEAAAAIVAWVEDRFP